jgi:hypothetical protein
MVRTAAQHSRIAAIYERAARDETLPPQARAAFANKGSWFRMLAQIEAAKAAAAPSATPDLTAKKRNSPKFNSEKGNVARINSTSSHGPTLAEGSRGTGGVRGLNPVGFLTREILSRNGIADGATPGDFGDGGRTIES